MELPFAMKTGDEVKEIAKIDIFSLERINEFTRKWTGNITASSDSSKVVSKQRNQAKLVKSCTQRHLLDQKKIGTSKIQEVLSRLQRNKELALNKDEILYNNEKCDLAKSVSVNPNKIINDKESFFKIIDGKDNMTNSIKNNIQEKSKIESYTNEKILIYEESKNSNSKNENKSKLIPNSKAIMDKNSELDNLSLSDIPDEKNEDISQSNIMMSLVNFNKFIISPNAEGTQMRKVPISQFFSPQQFPLRSAKKINTILRELSTKASKSLSISGKTKKYQAEIMYD